MRDLLSRLIGENVALDLNLDPQLGLVHMDQSQAQQILLNLVLNARDALPEGGRIIVETSNCTFQPLARSLSQIHPANFPCILLVVSDNGRGMSAETRQRLFEPFFTTKSNGKGTGLGLTISMRLVELMGGKIWVESAIGCGAKFNFTVIFKPCTQPSRAELKLKPVRREADRSLTILRVLVAEDNSVNQRLISRLLEKRGHEVNVVKNGLEALRALAIQNYDLVLMDMQMPELDGLETTARIRMKETAGGKHQPIVALTANAMSGDEERCRAAGMDGYLTKPIQSEKLDEVLEKYAIESAAQPEGDPRFANRH